MSSCRSAPSESSLTWTRFRPWPLAINASANSLPQTACFGATPLALRNIYEKSSFSTNVQSQRPARFPARRLWKTGLATAIEQEPMCPPLDYNADGGRDDNPSPCHQRRSRPANRISNRYLRTANAPHIFPTRRFPRPFGKDQSSLRTAESTWYSECYG